MIQKRIIRFLKLIILHIFLINNGKFICIYMPLIKKWQATRCIMALRVLNCNYILTINAHDALNAKVPKQLEAAHASLVATYIIIFH